MDDRIRTESTQLFLAEVGRALGLCPHVVFEFSIKLRPHHVETGGRLTCWLVGKTNDSFLPMARLLERLAAPEVVMEAQRSAVCPQRQGISISVAASGTELRLYLHGQKSNTLADTYEAWRWAESRTASRSSYSFHYLPETASGLCPQDLCVASLRPAFAVLLQDERLQQCSGFWLREDQDGRLDQVDLAFPWNPQAETLWGLHDVAKLLKVELEPSWRQLPIRHCAFPTGDSEPSVTLYASALRNGSWPETESELSDMVCRSARKENQDLDVQLFGKIGAATAVPQKDSRTDSFYDGNTDLWRQILGPDLHYHFGIFEQSVVDPNPEQMAVALRRAVTELYPFLPAGERIYDVGCGWGGPLAMWTRDLGCPSLGITTSRTQYRHVASLGLPVRFGDAEQTLPPGRFACAVLLESLSHIRDKARLLGILRLFCDRLVMRVNCQDAAPPGLAFSGTMHMISSATLRRILEAVGWRIRHFVDRRMSTLPSISAWRKRLEEVPAELDLHDAHLAALRQWTARVVQFPSEWARNNPLIEVMAD